MQKKKKKERVSHWQQRSEDLLLHISPFGDGIPSELRRVGYFLITENKALSNKKKKEVVHVLERVP
jgi:hypothetical protein